MTTLGATVNEQDNAQHSIVHPTGSTALFAPLHTVIDELWAGLVNAERGGPCQRVAFVSANHGDGTTCMASCAAIGLAHHLREPVILVELNLRRPKLSEFFLGASGSLGISDVLMERVPLDEAILDTNLQTLKILPGGTPREPSAAEFTQSAAGSILGRLTHGRSFLVLDLPPILSCPESRMLLKYVDRALLVVRSGKTARVDVSKAARLIQGSGTQLGGVLLNRFRREAPRWLSAQ